MLQGFHAFFGKVSDIVDSKSASMLVFGGLVGRKAVK